jgi:CDP-diacylglycerol--glycerol-3-phosphate 3-phosphatidyltransferase
LIEIFGKRYNRGSTTIPLESDVTVANYITFFRIAMIPVVALGISLFTVDRQEYRIATAVLFIVVALSDWVDGVVARKFGQRSLLGERLDPAADKLLTNVTLVFIAVNPHFVISVPMWLPAIVILRDATILIGSYIVVRFFENVRPRPRILGKVTTWTQGITIAGILLQVPFAGYLIWLLVAVTGASFIDYCLFGYEKITSKTSQPTKEH